MTCSTYFQKQIHEVGVKSACERLGKSLVDVGEEYSRRMPNRGHI